MIRIIPFRLMTWQNWHLRLIDALTFMFFHPFFHKIAKHAAVSPSPNPDTLTSTVLHGLVARCLPRRSLRFITRPSGDAVRWNGIHRKTFRNPWLFHNIPAFQPFVKSKYCFFTKLVIYFVDFPKNHKKFFPVETAWTFRGLISVLNVILKYFSKNSWQCIFWMYINFS